MCAKVRIFFGKKWKKKDVFGKKWEDLEKNFLQPRCPLKNPIQICNQHSIISDGYSGIYRRF